MAYVKRTERRMGRHVVVIAWSAEYQEFRCRLDEMARTDYFTDNFDDAVGTAYAMLRFACLTETCDD